MKGSFEEALARVLKHEGGFANHPDDPGGATMQGVTQSTYDAYRRRERLPQRSVRHIAQAELRAIYRRDYWDVVRGDDLPPGVDYAVFDFAVNSGPRRAARFLQRAVGAEDDGVVGPITLAAVGAVDEADVIRRICADRLAWLQQLSTWRTFGKGWERRVQEVRAHALLDVDEVTPWPAAPKPENEASPADDRNQIVPPTAADDELPPADDLSDFADPDPDPAPENRRHPWERAAIIAVLVGLAFLVWWLLPRGAP